MALSKKTQDHEEIRRWAEERGGKPAEVRSTENEDEPGILRIMFPGARNANDSNLQEIGWDEFFAKFDDNGLELIYQEQNAEGQKSNFNKLIYPENETKSLRGGSSAARSKAGGARKSASGSRTASRSSSGSAGRSSAAKRTSAVKSSGAKSRSASGTKSASRKSPAKSPAKSSARSSRSGGRSGKSAA